MSISFPNVLTPLILYTCILFYIYIETIGARFIYMHFVLYIYRNNRCPFCVRDYNGYFIVLLCLRVDTILTVVNKKVDL